MSFGWGESEKVSPVGRMGRLRRYAGRCGAKQIKFNLGPGFALKGRLLSSLLDDLTWCEPEGAQVQIFEDGELIVEGTPTEILANTAARIRLSEG